MTYENRTRRGRFHRAPGSPAPSRHHESERQESNLLFPDPKSGGLPFAFSRMVPRARVERASLRLQRSAVTGSAVEGCGTPCRLRSDLAGVKIRRPPRSRTGHESRRRDSNSTCDATSVGCSQNAPAILRDERRVAARAGFEPAVGRLTAACVSASPPGNESRRARHVAREARRRHVLSSCQRSWRSDERAHQGLRRDHSRRSAPSGFVESRTRSVRLRGGCSAN